MNVNECSDSNRTSYTDQCTKIRKALLYIKYSYM